VSKYKTNMLGKPPITMSRLEADRVSEILSAREGVKYRFYCFLNLSRFSLQFESDSGEQKVLSIDTVKSILKEAA
jgi:hypothetical protein